MAKDNPLEGVDLTTLSPQDFASLVKNAPAGQLDEVMADAEWRDRILNAVFSRMGEQYAGNKKVDAVIHWKILDRPDGEYDQFETVLENGECTVNTQPQHTEPRVTIRISGPQFLRLASGNSSPTTMFFTGKLKLAGDVGFAAGLASLFDIPSAK